MGVEGGDGQEECSGGKDIKGEPTMANGRGLPGAFTDGEAG